jgi:hypothetical protein
MVPVSGIYRVLHDGHRDDHEVLAIRGEAFPACRICNVDVKFQVAQVTPHVTHDFDLAGPDILARRPRARAAKRAG